MSNPPSATDSTAATGSGTPPGELSRVRDAVITRYSGLAQRARSGARPLDSEESQDGCFGAAAYDQDDAPQAALHTSLGCGNPLTIADLHQGETVLDLGSGGGLDVLLSARRVGPTGHAYGLDASPDMLDLARANAAQAQQQDQDQVATVEFLHGHIEDIPLPDHSVDVVISNCVINLSADKPAVLAEAFRVLRPGGRLGISDVIAEDGLDPAQRTAEEQRAGCTTGTLTAGEYQQILTSVGFTHVTITPTAEAGGGLHSAAIKATKPH